MTEKSKSKSFRETVWTVLFAIGIAMLVRTFAFEPFNIPSGSMIPTLLVGDYLFVSKYSYGYSRYSMPFGLPLVPGRVLYTEPERGDVAVFKLPRDNKTDYIKRIIGLPGDRIQMVRGVLHVNGQPVTRERIEDFVHRDGPYVRRIPRFAETLPNGKRHEILEAYGDNGPVDNTNIYTVPDDHFFAMGDNRDNSTDSRFGRDVGFVPKANLVGRAEVIFFSIDGSFWAFWKWFGTIRGSRIFMGIE